MPKPMLSKRSSLEDADDNPPQGLVSVENNKIMFYSDVDTKTCLKLISCLDQAKQYVAVQNSLNEFDEPMKVYIHICIIINNKRLIIIEA